MVIRKMKGKIMRDINGNGRRSYSEWVKKKNQEHRQGGKMSLGSILIMVGIILVVGYFIIKVIFY